MEGAYLPAEQCQRPAVEPSIHHSLEFYAQHSPDALAILAPGRAPLTYGRLWMHIESTLNQLSQMGIGRGDRVALVLPNGPEMAVAFLAMAMGATAAPLNPAYGAKELDYYLSDLQAKALIVQAGLDSPALGVARKLGVAAVGLTPLAEAEAGLFTLAGEDVAAAGPSDWAGPDDVALVLHTSGTTARPKIVPLTQANLCVSAANIGMAFGLGAHDRCLNVMPLFHIHGLVGALLSSLAVGASVVCTPGFGASAFFTWLEEYRPTWYTAVPTMHQAVVERAGGGQAAPHHSLRFIRSCSSALPPQVMAGLERVFGVPVLEAYGMTEAAHQMASNPLPPGQRKPGSVGVATGTKVAIMDEAGELLPPGERGEIVVRGANVMGGYEHNPEANARAFTRGWFRTGDQGYLDGDGYLFISGRLKEIINRGGEKISPREVDEVLLDHPAVAQAVTFAVAHPRLGEEVAAAVVLREGATAEGQEIRQYAAGRLAYFKVPRQVVILDEIPKGPTGKVQRVGLAERLGLDASTAGEAVAYVAPRNPIEALLADLWAEVLHVEQVGVDDDFLQLGGDSILATLVVARLRQAVDVDISLPRFFTAGTVAGLAKVVEEILLGEVEDRTDDGSQPDAPQLEGGEGD